MTDPARNKLAAAILIVVSIVGMAGLIYNRRAFDDADALVDDAAAIDEWEKIAGGALLGVDTWVREIETDRLVCAIARRSRSVAISCVPKIPGLFDEPPLVR